MKSLLIALLVASAACAWASPPMDGLSSLHDFRAMRSSSSDKDIEGNADARRIEPGAALVLGELAGPGRIVHIWFTISSRERCYGKLLVLRMYWDGETNPSVECPLNDFFCQGHGMDLMVNSLPIRVTSNGRARNCYWPMPFAKSAKITVTNEGEEPVNAFYYYIDWQKLPRLPENQGYFHACYRQEFPCVQGRDYLILDAEGRGHFVGCNLSVRNREAGWWGEGDDKFYIDGETIPSLIGTGSEDYFCDAWGVRQADGLFYGFPLAEGFDAGQRCTNYRFHIQDPIPFTKSLVMRIEHKGARLMPDGKNWTGYAERADDYSSVAYWYQTEPHKPFEPLPPAKERLCSADAIVIEGESLVESAQASEGAPVKQDLGGWSGDSQLFFTPQKSPAWVAVRFPVPREGKYVVSVTLTKSHDYGIYRVLLDGAAVGKAEDLYTPEVTRSNPIRLGVFNLKAGEHEIRFETSSKNPASTGFYFGLDCIELVPQP